ncbi:hypothetical protein VCHA53O466_50207 [Vibrio chagasii]|nr:hypothetical protein VCHA53O466_50207 [Vibrio chagasii]
MEEYNKLLKPCPFCKGKAELESSHHDYSNGEHTTTYVAKCTACFVSRQALQSVDSAVEHWNQRDSVAVHDSSNYRAVKAFVLTPSECDEDIEAHFDVYDLGYKSQEKVESVVGSIPAMHVEDYPLGTTIVISHPLCPNCQVLVGYCECDTDHWDIEHQYIKQPSNIN